MQTVKLIVKGKVQGVYYRQSTREKAQQLGISGTVRNLDDKNVEILASAEPEQLQQLEEWCRHGPPRAEVIEVLVEIIPWKEFDGFTVVKGQK